MAGLNDNFLFRAVKELPVLRYAIGVAAVAAAVSVARGFLPDVGLIAMMPIIGGAMLTMGLLIIVGAAAAAPKTRQNRVAMALLWAICLFVIILLIFTISAIAFGVPERWAQLILPEAGRAAAVEDRTSPPPAPIASSDVTPTDDPAAAAPDAPDGIASVRDNSASGQTDAPQPRAGWNGVTLGMERTEMVQRVRGQWVSVEGRQGYRFETRLIDRPAVATALVDPDTGRVERIDLGGRRSGYTGRRYTYATGAYELATTDSAAVVTEFCDTVLTDVSIVVAEDLHVMLSPRDERSVDGGPALLTEACGHFPAGANCHPSGPSSQTGWWRRARGSSDATVTADVWSTSASVYVPGPTARQDIILRSCVWTVSIA